MPSFDCNPKLILADEPTGNLDSKSGRTCWATFINREYKATILMVTHDILLPSVIKIMFIRVSEIYNGLYAGVTKAIL